MEEKERGTAFRLPCPLLPSEVQTYSKWSIQSYSLSMKTSLVHYSPAPNSSNRGNISISSPDASYYAYRMWKKNRSHSKYATITKTTIIS